MQPDKKEPLRHRRVQKRHLKLVKTQEPRPKAGCFHSRKSLVPTPNEDQTDFLLICNVCGAEWDR